MSNRHRVSRVVFAISLIVVPTLFACASHPEPATNVAPINRPRDTTSPPNVSGEGKSVEELFAGKFPGVDVKPSNDGGLHITIRGGANSVMGGEEPLIVIDDVPQAAGARGIVYLNPRDIERIDVLKNPADIAVYGTRGANGVIRIRTKRPGR